MGGGGREPGNSTPGLGDSGRGPRRPCLAWEPLPSAEPRGTHMLRPGAPTPHVSKADTREPGLLNPELPDSGASFRPILRLPPGTWVSGPLVRLTAANELLEARRPGRRTGWQVREIPTWPGSWSGRRRLRGHHGGPSGRVSGWASQQQLDRVGTWPAHLPPSAPPPLASLGSIWKAELSESLLDPFSLSPGPGQGWTPSQTASRNSTRAPVNSQRDTFNHTHLDAVPGTPGTLGQRNCSQKNLGPGTHLPGVKFPWPVLISDFIRPCLSGLPGKSGQGFKM